MLWLEFVVDILLVAMLGATIAYCWVLNKRIRVLQDARSELAKLLKHFDESTNRASDSILALQTASKKIGEVMQSRIERANFVAEDLSFLVEKGEKLADKLEAGVNINRNIHRVEQQMEAERKRPQIRIEPVEPEPQDDEVEMETAEERERKEMEKKKTLSSLHAMLERLAAHSSSSDPALKGQRASRFPETRARSRAELELIEAIRSNKE